MSLNIISKLKTLRESKLQKDFIELHKAIEKEGFFSSRSSKYLFFASNLIFVLMSFSIVFCHELFMSYAVAGLFFVFLFYKKIYITFLIYKSYMQWKDYSGREFPSETIRFDRVFDYENRFQIKKIIPKGSIVFSFRRLISEDGLSFEFVTWHIFKPFSFSRSRVCCNFNKFDFDRNYQVGKDRLHYEIKSISIIVHIINLYFPDPTQNDLKENIWYY